MRADSFVSFHIDVDGEWITHDALGRKSPVWPDPFFKALARFEKLFDEFGIKATFFVVGKDLLIDEKRNAVARLANAGHELANHTMNHPFGLSSLSQDEQEKEINEAETLIAGISGEKPRGFRAPSYDIDANVMNLLERRGYLYDSSVFPSGWPFVQKGMTKILFRGEYHAPNSISQLRNAVAPVAPYYPSHDAPNRKGSLRKIVELPLSVTPIIRFPFYSTLHMTFGNRFFDLCQLTLRRSVPLVYLFHLVDLTDPDADGLSEWGRLPPAPIPLHIKMDRMRHIIKTLLRHRIPLRGDQLAENQFDRVSESAG